MRTEDIEGYRETSDRMAELCATTAWLSGHESVRMNWDNGFLWESLEDYQELEKEYRALFAQNKVENDGISRLKREFCRVERDYDIWVETKDSNQELQMRNS